MKKIVEKTVQQTIALTWSPDPSKYSHVTKPYTQLCEHYRTVLFSLRLASFFSMYPEMHANGNLHYHGIVKIFDKVKWFKFVLPHFKRNGYICIKTNVDDGWHDYCAKEAELTSKILGITLPIGESDDLALLKCDYYLASKHKKEIDKLCLTNNGKFINDDMDI